VSSEALAQEDAFELSPSGITIFSRRACRLGTNPVCLAGGRDLP